MGTPTILLARTDAEAADLVTSDVDLIDQPFCTGERTVEGFYRTKKGFDQAVSRGLAYAEVADLIWCETGTPDLKFAKDFADAIHAKFPGKLLAYNCSPSFNWRKNLDDATIAKFQKELGAMGYKFQFITLAGFHSLNYSMFELAYGYARNNMSAFVELQQKEFAAAEKGFTAVKHQREVGTGYFDAVTTTIEANASTAALKGRPRTSSSSTTTARRPPERHLQRQARGRLAAGFFLWPIRHSGASQEGTHGSFHGLGKDGHVQRERAAHGQTCPDHEWRRELRIDSENINENFEVEKQTVITQCPRCAGTGQLPTG